MKMARDGEKVRVVEEKVPLSVGLEALRDVRVEHFAQAHKLRARGEAGYVCGCGKSKECMVLTCVIVRYGGDNR